MIIKVYKKTLESIKKNTIKIWGISLLCMILISLGALLFPIPGITLAIGWIFEASMCVIYLKYYAGEEVCSDQLFDLFKDKNKLLHVLGGMAWMALKVFLWLLIPVAGIFFAIVRTYEYRLTPYILINEPEISIKDAIVVSKERTNGYKLKMFLADFLWLAAASIVSTLLYLLSMLNYVGWLFGIVNIIFSLFISLFAYVISGIIKSAFYFELFNRNSTSYYDDDAKVCENCGAIMRNGDVFCSVCGAKNGKKIENIPDNSSDNVTD